MKKFLCAVLSVGLFAAAVSAQNSNAKTQTKFTSVYSDLNRNCKTLRGTNGTDDAQLCRGPGRYEVEVYFAAAAMLISAGIKGEQKSFNLATTDFGFDTRKTKIEWRLANGQPFAAIIRLPKYADPAGDNQYFGKVIGERLAVVGLEGNESINFSVDAKDADANAKARESADKAYSSLQKDQ